MPLLVISLLTILAGALLLSKFKKEMQGKCLMWIAYFFIIVGFLLFIGFIAGGICKLKHHGFKHHGFRYEMMGKGHGHGHFGMMHREPGCCPPEMMHKGMDCCPEGMIQKGMDCCPEGMMEKGKDCCPEGMMQKGKDCCPGGMMGKGHDCGMKADTACCPGGKKTCAEPPVKAAAPAKPAK